MPPDPPSGVTASPSPQSAKPCDISLFTCKLESSAIVSNTDRLDTDVRCKYFVIQF